ncbi:MAG: hemolysin III family protein [Acutalibacteraceae bacterium]
MNEECISVKMRANRSRSLPTYSKNEETANMITHILGGVFAFFSLILCAVFAAWHKNISGIISGVIYGISMIIVYVISSVYHGLDPDKAYKGKVVLRVLDHCDIYGLIVGTFAPIALTGLRQVNPIVAWVSLSLVLLTAAIGTVFTAIDFSKFKVISYGAYFVAGWSVIMTVRQMLLAFSKEFIILLIVGGVVYTSGMIFYGLQYKGYKYCHSIFHLFILAGSIIHFIAIFKYCI